MCKIKDAFEYIMINEKSWNSSDLYTDLDDPDVYLNQDVHLQWVGFKSCWDRITTQNTMSSEQLSQPQGDAEPVLWALKWPEDKNPNHATVFPSKSMAEDYAKGCLNAGEIEIVPLCTRTPIAGLDDAHTRKKERVIDNLHDAVDNLKAELKAANARLDMIDKHQQDSNPDDLAVWYWQGDGEDHPESLLDDVPVVIKAGDLNAMIASSGVPEGFYCSAAICNSCGHVYMERPSSCDCGNDQSIDDLSRRLCLFLPIFSHKLRRVSDEAKGYE